MAARTLLIPRTVKIIAGVIAAVVPFVFAAVLFVATTAAAGNGVGSGSSVFGPVDASGWAWPSETRVVTQQFHDGYSIDLASPPGGRLFAPYDGVVVVAGFDGGIVPPVCLANLSWWRGPNHIVMIRHELPSGQLVYSALSHIAPGSPAEAGITVGSTVRAGQWVASEGMSGCTGGPHLHFTLSTTPRFSNPDVNPCPFLGPPCDF